MATIGTLKNNGTKRRGFLRRRWFALLLLLIVLLVSAYYVFSKKEKPEEADHSTATITRGDIVKTISATGTIEPLVTVQVGSQVSGTIAELNVDFNSRVKKGDVIAKLDQDIYRAQLDQSRANMRFQESAVQASEANVEKARLALAEDQRIYLHTKELFDKAIASDDDVEVAKAKAEQTRSLLNQAQAQLNQVKAQLDQSRASVQLAEVQMEKTVITSPIDGVVIARNVDVGQTVAASLQAPTLFLIANDLTRMQVLTDIDEADVGGLRDNTEASFTVDAFRDDVFHCRISQIRMNSQVVQNVVTYTAVLSVDNPELKLMPGMTANVTIKAAEARNVLRLPNAALRYKPKLDTSLRGKLSELRTSEQEGGGKAPKAEGTEEGQGPHGSGAPSEAKGPHEGGQASPEMKGAPEGGASPEMKEAFRKMRGMKGKKNGNFQVVWVPDGKALKPVDVKLGLTDGTSSEILEGDLKEGSIVAVPTGTKEAFRMPFSPFGGGRR